MMKTRAIIFFAAILLLTTSLGWAQGFSALLSNFSVPLYDTCDAGVPAHELPDGLTVEIVHDVDLDGPDWTDPLATVCAEPPDCPTGPTGTVNYNSFPLNGQSWGVNGGMFYVSSAFTSSADLPSPNRFYLRICVEIEPGHPVYYIATQGHNGGGPLTNFSPPSGPSEWEFDTWTCTNGECEGNCLGRTAIQGFTASDSSCGFVGLSWTAYTDTVQVDSLFITRNGNLIKTVYRTATSAYDSTATVGTTYTYSISSRRVCGPGNYGWSPLANDLGQARSAPPVPTNMSASDGTCGSVTVAWSVPTTAGADSFHVFRNDTLIHRMLRTGGVGPFNYVHTTANGATATYSVKSVSLLCGAGTAASDPGTALQAPTAVVMNVNATDNLCDSVVVTWTDVPSGVTSYKVYRRNNDGTSPTLVGSVNQGMQRLKTSNGTAYTTYRYSLRAVNACGESANESAYDTGFWYTTPPQVTGVTATVDSFCTHVRINWTDLTTETGYSIYRSAVLIGTVGANVLTYNDSLGTAGTNYTYTVRGTNACGDGILSSGVNGKRKTVPSQVTGVTATDSSALYCWGVRVTWANVAGEDSFQIRRNGIRIGVRPADSLYFNDSTAVRGDTAAYSVVAYNSCGAGTPSITNQGSRKALPGQVTDLFASDTSCTQIFLKWNNVVREDSFRIIRNGEFLTTTVANDTDYVDFSVLSGTYYDYQIVAANQCGSGDTSSVATGVAFNPPPQVQNVQASTDRCDGIEISWDQVATSVDGYTIFEDGDSLISLGSGNDLYIYAPLTSGEHCYNVMAYSIQCGDGAWSDTVCGYLWDPPTKVTNVEASTNLCNGVQLSWSPADGEVSGYIINRDIGYIDSVDVGTTSYFDASAPGGTSKYVIIAYSEICEDAEPSDSVAGLRLIPPATPSNLSATDNGGTVCGGVIVTWNDVELESGYLLRRNGSFLGFVPADCTVFVDYPPAGRYAYSVQSFNECGASYTSVRDSGTAMTLAAADLSAALGDNCESITLEWTSSPNADSIRIIRDNDILLTISAVDSTFVDDSATPGMHDYWIIAVNECGDSSPSDTLSATLLEYPSVPAGLIADDNHCDEIYLSWTAPAGAFGTYNLYKDDLLIATVPQSQTTWTDTAVIGGMSYTYQVSAMNDTCGESERSVPLIAELTDMEPLATPQVVITIEGANARLYWNTITETLDGCPALVTGYLVFYSPEAEGPFYYHGFTTDTSYVHQRAVQFAVGMHYNVVAYAGDLEPVLEIEEGTLREQVTQRLHR